MNKKTLLIVSLLFISSISLAGDCVKAYFNTDCEKRVLRQITLAENEIHLAIYSFTRYSIAEALGKAHKRGIVVKVIADKKQAANAYSKKH